MTAQPGRGHLAVAVAGFTTALVGLGWLLSGTGPGPDPEPADDPVRVAVPPRADPRTAGVTPRTVVPRVAGVPRRVVIASPPIDAPVVGVRTAGTELDPPADVGVVGWWADGARAGSVRGTTLVTGHTVHDGGGVFDDLERVRRGTPVQVQTDAGTIVYVVASVRVLDKGTMARAAGRLFSQVVPGRLVLVTCEGWDGEGYRSNVVVVAGPA